MTLQIQHPAAASHIVLLCYTFGGWWGRVIVARGRRNVLRKKMNKLSHHIIKIRVACVLILIFTTWTCGGCGVYSVSSGRVDESIKRVAVPFLENRTAEPNLEIVLTEAIIEAIQDDNTLKVVEEKDADSILQGKVLQYRLKEAFTNPDLQVDEYQVQILVELDFTVVQTGEKIFEKRRITGTGNYTWNDPNDSNESLARIEAARDIVREVLAMVVEDW